MLTLGLSLSPRSSGSGGSGGTPVLSLPILAQSGLGLSTAVGSFTTDADTGTTYFVGIAKTAADYMAGTQAVSTPTAAAIKAGTGDIAFSMAITAAGAQAIGAGQISTLVVSRVYTFFAVHETAAGFSNVLTFPAFSVAADMRDWFTGDAAVFSPHLGSAVYEEHDAATTPATVGDVVGRVYNIVNPAAYMHAETSGNKVTLREDAAGIPYLEVTSIAQFLGAGGIPITGADHCAMVIAKAVSPSSEATIIQSHPTDVSVIGGGNHAFRIRFDTGSVLSRRNRSTAAGVDSATLAGLTGPECAIIHMDGAETSSSADACRIWINDGAETSTLVSPYSSTATVLSSVGYAFFRRDVTNEWRGNLYAIIMWEGTPTSGGSVADLQFAGMAAAGVAGIPASVPFVGAEVGALSALVIPSADETTIELTVDLPSGNWTTPVVDASRISASAPSFRIGDVPAVVSASVSATGGTATVTVQLDRAVVRNEELFLTFDVAWLFDAIGNSVVAQSDAPVVNRSTLHYRTTDTIVWSGITWGLDASYEVATYVDFAAPAVVVPSGSATITSKLPAPTTSSGSIVHGIGLNMPRGLQGMDQRAPSWNAGKNRSLPLVCSANDAVVGVISAIPGYAADNRTLNIQAYGGVQFVATRPAFNDVCPGLFGYDGTAAREAPSIDLAAVKAARPRYARASLSVQPPLDAVKFRFNRLELSHVIDQEEAARSLCVPDFTADDGYGTDYVGTCGAACVITILDYTDDEIDSLMRWVITLGTQAYYSVSLAGAGISPGGGYGGQGLMGPVGLAAFWAGRVPGSGDDIMSGMPAVMEGNFFGQPFLASASDISVLNTPHSLGDAGSLPYCAKRKTVTAVSGTSNRNIDCQGMTQIEAGVAGSRVTYLNMKIIRETISGGTPDGVSSARVVGYSQNYTDPKSWGPFICDTAEVAAWSPAPAVGDVIYAVPAWTIAEGEACWALKGPGDPYNCQTPDSDYRRLNKWAAEVLSLMAWGAVPEEWAASIEYCALANGSTAPGGPYSLNYPDMFEPFVNTTGNDNSFAAAAWASHWATASANAYL